MGKPLCDYTVYEVVTFRGLSFSGQEICDNLRLKSRYVAASAYRRFPKNGSHKARKSTGGPKKFDARMERKRIREVKQPQDQCRKDQGDVELLLYNKPVVCKNYPSSYKYGIRGRSAAKIFAMRLKTTLNWIRWCKQRKTWCAAIWKRIVLTDEVRFRLFSDGRVTVWRRNGKRFDDKTIPLV